ncbi:MAG: peptidyl-prolyl cis-trans isomerase-like 3 [Lasallia pustulata]|uniref:Peptidyl-prolyl cis-trans isomerase n=1 Tax=Lasallia pustulata TaxID=136370 RepID=A0A5M8PC05_9LECA|nr:MAG: peptidyl-prolyl cis-trans isomerase-like 3 [Lasallia pustulata]
MSVTLHTTLGDLKIEVFCESVPKTAENFLALCASSFYTSLPIHRSLPAFMLQTGAPDPAHKRSTSIWGGYFADEIRPSLRHNARGIVSMANRGKDTNGSQFFICYAPAPHLDGKNTVFGQTDGKGRVKERVVIEGVTVHANPLAG